MRTARTNALLSEVKNQPYNSEPAVGELRAASATSTPVVPHWIERARPRGIRRVPTHTVGVTNERRGYARAQLRLPLKVTRVAGQRQLDAVRLCTRDISSSGVFFLCPHRIEPGTPIEIEVALVDRPNHRGSVRMITEAHIVRTEPARANGWHGLAALFDDITFLRTDPLPPRFHTV
jgi:PilZ domain-containing protein